MHAVHVAAFSTLPNLFILTQCSIFPGPFSIWLQLSKLLIPDFLPPDWLWLRTKTPYPDCYFTASAFPSVWGALWAEGKIPFCGNRKRGWVANSERLKIQLDNGQTIDDNRTLTHNLCSHWLPTSLCLPHLYLWTNQSKPDMLPHPITGNCF